VVPTHTQFNLCELFSRQPLFPTGLLSFWCGGVRARFPYACYTYRQFSRLRQHTTLVTHPCTGIYLIVSPKFIPKLLSGYLGATQLPTYVSNKSNANVTTALGSALYAFSLFQKPSELALLTIHAPQYLRVVDQHG